MNQFQCILNLSKLLQHYSFLKLYKRFGEFIAVNHIDLVVPRGSFYGVVGPNGAGKTTSLSMAVGLLRPDSGSAKVLELMFGVIQNKLKH